MIFINLMFLVVSCLKKNEIFFFLFQFVLIFMKTWQMAYRKLHVSGSMRVILTLADIYKIKTQHIILKFLY